MRVVLDAGQIPLASIREMQELAERLGRVVQTGDGAFLEPRFVKVALDSLRELSQEQSRMFRIELLGKAGAPVRVLATVNDEVIARAAFTEAVKGHANQVVRLTGGGLVLLNFKATSAAQC